MELSRRGFLKALGTGTAGGAIALRGSSARAFTDCSGPSPTGGIPQYPLPLFDTGLHKDQLLLPQSHQDFYDQYVRPRITWLGQAGAPDPASGKIGFIAIGASDLLQYWGGHYKRELGQNQFFEWDAKTHPLRHPRVEVLCCARGGLTVNALLDPSEQYWTGTDRWNSLYGLLHDANGNWILTPEQVQVVCYEPLLAMPWLVTDPLGELEAKTLDCLQVLRETFPNLRIVLFASRPSSAFALPNGYREPHSWEQGVACKRIIDRQIDGDLSPWPFLAWGPYCWTNGATPAANLPWLSWAPFDFKDVDGSHPSVRGIHKWSEFFLLWLLLMPWCTWFRR